jgi:hypothetical protein
MTERTKIILDESEISRAAAPTPGMRSAAC